ncbi:hypothetical protein E5206_09325 [Arthrobacter sp. PAMC25564]|uniref:hypothetical protein n=1 Tax=Arthrobacter sp. PAMC25564 TaxID=2565366 RepID=UPI0010A29ACD|nr:hypothetical protein [Arthrobacter sp. PAMC25564]QCB97104.1 hypothetical protein E5206_09325 [Arthrobacter sp. PAMC25564]
MTYATYQRVRMSLNNFSIVFAGENFPISSIKTTDFVFRHRELVETVRLPVLLQAAAGGASIDVLHDRFVAAVTSPDKVEVQTEGLQDLARTFLEYVGKRTIRATGHNLQFSLDGVDAPKQKIADHFLRRTAVQDALGSPVFGADLQFLFDGDNHSRVRVGLVTEGVDVPTIDFNFNFEAAEISPEDALTAFGDSYRRALTIVEKLRQAIESEVTV